MEIVNSLLNLIEKIVWPIIIYIIFLYFGDSIKNLLVSIRNIINERGLKLTRSGLEIPGIQEEPETIKDLIYTPAHFKEVLKQNSPESLEEPLFAQKGKNPLKAHEQKIIEDILFSLEEFIKEEKNKNNKKKIEDILKNMLCDAYIRLYFERSFQRILGSQLYFLKSLDLYRDGEGLTYEDSKNIFRSSTPLNSSISFEDWINFLEKSKFIIQSSNKIYITKEGKEFLQYILNRGYSFKKSG